MISLTVPWHTILQRSLRLTASTFPRFCLFSYRGAWSHQKKGRFSKRGDKLRRSVSFIPSCTRACARIFVLIGLCWHLSRLWSLGFITPEVRVVLQVGWEGHDISKTLSPPTRQTLLPPADSFDWWKGIWFRAQDKELPKVLLATVKQTAPNVEEGLLLGLYRDEAIQILNADDKILKQHCNQNRFDVSGAV